MDRWAAAHPNPGWRPFQRLTRAEYAHAVSDLLAVDVDVTAFLPPDTMSQGFDNIADTQAFSPALPQGYLRAASQISRLAVGDRAASAATATYTVPATENQMLYVEGTPFGSRGGTAFVHTFPADGLYKFQATLVSHGERGVVRQYGRVHGGQEGAARNLRQRRARRSHRSRLRHERLRAKRV